MAAAIGLAGFQFSIEADRASIVSALNAFRDREAGTGRQQKGRKIEISGRPQVGLTVYGTPPLFTSRAESDQRTYNQIITSPRGEQFITTRKGGQSYTRPIKPFSLLPYRNELQNNGIDYIVVDLSGMKTSKREVEGLADRLAVRDRLPKLPTFNYLGRLG